MCVKHPFPQERILVATARCGVSRMKGVKVSLWCGGGCHGNRLAHAASHVCWVCVCVCVCVCVSTG